MDLLNVLLIMVFLFLIMVVVYYFWINNYFKSILFAYNTKSGYGSINGFSGLGFYFYFILYAYHSYSFYLISFFLILGSSNYGIGFIIPIGTFYLYYVYVAVIYLGGTFGSSLITGGLLLNTSSNLYFYYSGGNFECSILASFYYLA